MARAHSSSPEPSFFSLPHAKWVLGVLNMLIAVVGRESLLGLILRQTRTEIRSLVKDEEAETVAVQAHAERAVETEELRARRLITPVAMQAGIVGGEQDVFGFRFGHPGAYAPRLA